MRTPALFMCLFALAGCCGSSDISKSSGDAGASTKPANELHPNSAQCAKESEQTCSSCCGKCCAGVMGLARGLWSKTQGCRCFK